jgi:hypothetical protein
MRAFQIERNGQGLFNATLYKMAKSLPPTKIVKKEKASKAKPRAVSDATVKEILRKSLTGETTAALALEYGVKASAITSWRAGINRAHLLIEVEKELANGSVRR